MLTPLIGVSLISSSLSDVGCYRSFNNDQETLSNVRNQFVCIWQERLVRNVLNLSLGGLSLQSVGLALSPAEGLFHVQSSFLLLIPNEADFKRQRRVHGVREGGACSLTRIVKGATSDLTPATH